MDKQLIKKELIDYNRQFKKMMGTFGSFEIVYDYINFITSNLYLDEKLLPIAATLQKEAENAKNSSINMEEVVIDISSPEGLNKMPVFKEQYSAWQKELNNKKSLSPMIGLPIYFAILSEAAFLIHQIKECQSLGKMEEVKTLIEEVKNKSFSIVDTVMVTGAEFKKMTYGQIIDISMELVNKFLIDEIDSEILLEKDKPKANLSYDSDNCLLYINGRTIKIQLRAIKPLDSFILEALFSNNDNLGEEMDFSEIASYFDSESSYNNSKDYQRYRHSCDNLNNKVAKQTEGNINDFIIYTTGKTGWCKINPKYL